MKFDQEKPKILIQEHQAAFHDTGELINPAAIEGLSPLINTQPLEMDTTTVLNVTRANPLKKTGNGDYVTGSGGVERALVQATITEDGTLAMNSYSNSEHVDKTRENPRGTLFSVETIDKRDVTQLGLTEHQEPINHHITELRISPEQFKGFRKASIVPWWVHHGSEFQQQLSEDLTQSRATGVKFSESVRGYLHVGTDLVRGIQQMPLLPERVVIHDPYYFPTLASKLEEQLPEVQRFGVNHIPFASPKDLETMFNIVSPTQGDRLASFYMQNWMQFDVISMHSVEDAENFRESAREFCPNTPLLTELRVNPLGVAIEEIEHTADSITTEEEMTLLDLVVKHADHIDTPEQLEGLILGASIGYRSDPIKRIPKLEATIDTLLQMRPDLIGKFTYVQQIRPHRTDDFISYKQEYDEIVQGAHTLNVKYVTQYKERTGNASGWQPFILMQGELQNPQVIKLQRALSNRAKQMLNIVLSKEGMNLAGQEGFFASGRSDYRLITTRDSGLGRYLSRRGISTLTENQENAPVEQLAQRVNSAIMMPTDKAIALNQRTRQALEDIDAQHWAKRLHQPKNVIFDISST
ncbi:MAG TPA: hypothetical protein VLG12_01190 [Candidatus Saccharimonadales bacterium]|nr:hypothetical protein [Candidatus Saccharimonadales bacterium]